MIYKLNFLLLVCLLSSCGIKPCDNIIKGSDISNNIRNMKTKCDSIYYKELTFEIIHEKLDSNDLSEYTLVINIDGIVYNDKYRKKILISNFDLCDDFAMNHTELTIYLIDKKNNIKYKWRNKRLYAFEKYSNYNIVLKSKYEPDSEQDLNSYFIDYK